MNSTSKPTLDLWRETREIVERGIARGVIIPPVLERFAARRPVAPAVHEDRTLRAERTLIDGLFGASREQFLARSEARGVSLRPVVWECLEHVAAEQGMTVPQLITCLARYHVLHASTLNAALEWPPRK